MAAPRFVNHAHVFPSAMNADGTIERLLRLLDKCSIEQAVCFAPYPHQWTDHDVDTSTWLAREIKSRPRLYGFGTVDVRRDDLPDQARRIADLGMRGIKM